MMDLSIETRKSFLKKSKTKTDSKLRKMIQEAMAPVSIKKHASKSSAFS